MAALRGPTVPRRRLGAELRRLRDEASLTLDQVAEQLECSTSKISRLETGKGIPKARDVRDMLFLYGVQDARVQERLLRWAREGQQQGWWHDFADLLEEKDLTFVALEAEAVTMRSYEIAVVHGLLQTQGYARAIAEVIWPDLSPAALQQFLELRLLRQEVLSQAEGALQFDVVIEEVALYRPAGSSEVWREQLVHLLDLAKRPNIRFHVLPLSVGLHPALTGSFTLLEFAADEVDHGVVFAEGVGGGVIVEHNRVVDAYAQVFDTIRRRALDTEKSAEFVAGVLRNVDQ